MADLSKGGRGKKAPYSSTHYRIPEPIKPVVEQLASTYRQLVGRGNDAERLLDSVASVVDKAQISQYSKPGTDLYQPCLKLIDEYLVKHGLTDRAADPKRNPRFDQLMKFKSWLEEQS